MKQELDDFAVDQVEATDFLDLSDDVVVELLKPLGRNPILQDRLTSDLMYVELIEVGLFDIEPDHEPDPRRFHIPVAGDHRRVLLVEYGIEDRLIWQTRRSSARPA